MNVRYQPTEEQIRKRAYEIYLEHGCQPGHEIDHWLQAEYELMQLPIAKIAEMPAHKPKRGRNTRASLVTLVQAALVMGADALINMRH
jgi:hypothetical protein